MARRSPNPNQASNIPLGGGGQWLELSVTVPSLCADRVAESLIALGSPGVVEEAATTGTVTLAGQAMSLVKLTAAFPLEHVNEQLLGEVRRCIDALGSGAATQTVTSMRLTQGGAWLKQWKRFYRPFKVGRHLIIRPPWEPYAAADGDVVLTLNPGRAFGTGLHATTQLCLDFLEALAPARLGARLLDVGCGSGILSLAAVLFGFREAVGVDLDRIAVRVARTNARLNHLTKQVTFATGSLEAVAGPFEVIVANILLEPIVAMLKDLHAVLAPGGTVILSGLLSSEGPQLRRGLTRHGWHILQQGTQQEWAAVLCGEV
ncbi:MAG: 50S ribosomal protein L11 methyltransferase [Nitrospinae bacterium]|nr:50S ribosomal protein L11 methyltransferase [Nitrospinota bacterium]